MNELEKEFILKKIKELGKRDEIILEQTEDTFKAKDSYGIAWSYSWEEELYQKVKHIPDKLYAYKKISGKTILYLLETTTGECIKVYFLPKTKKIYFLTNHSTWDRALIKEIYAILQEFMENKKEYRLRILTGIIQLRVEKRLWDILEETK